MSIQKLILVISIIILLAVTGCSNTNYQSSDIEQETAKQTLSFWYYLDDENSQNQISELIKAFNKLKTDIQVKLEYVPLAEYRKRLSLGMVTGELPDIVMIKGYSQTYYAQKGMFFDITEYLEKNIPIEKYNSQAVSTCSIGKRLYGLPFSMTVQAMIFNEDIFNSVECSVPQNWVELKNCAKIIKENKDMYPIGFSGLESQYMTLQFLPFLWSTGGEISSIADENGLNAITYFSSLFSDELIDISTINLANTDMISQFTNKETAIIFTSSDRLTSLFNTKVNFKWSVAPIPYDKSNSSVFDTNNIAVINNKNSTLALEFLSYIADESNMQDYLNKLCMISPRNDILQKQYQTNSTINLYKEVIQNARYIPIYEKWDDISEGITASLMGSITNQLTPQQAINNAQNVIDRSLKE